MRRFLIALVLPLALATACKRSPATPPGPSVKLFVDDVEVGSVAVTGSPIPLAGRLPKAASDPASWRRIEARASGGRFLDVRKPSTTYANGEVRLYLQQQEAAIGVFRPVREGLPEHVAKIARQPAVSLAGITEVRVHTKDPPPVTRAELSVEATGLPKWTVFAEDLEELPEIAGDRSAGRGRALADLVAMRTAGQVDRVVVEARDGRSQTLSAADLADPGKRLVIRVNNKNQWVFKAFAAGADSPSAEVRDVVRLRIEGTNLRGRGGRGDGSGGSGGDGAGGGGARAQDGSTTTGPRSPSER